MVTKINTLEDLERIQKQYNDETAKYAHQVLVCVPARAACRPAAATCATPSFRRSRASASRARSSCARRAVWAHAPSGRVMLILPERVFFTMLTPESARAVVRSFLVSARFYRNIRFMTSLSRNTYQSSTISIFQGAGQNRAAKLRRYRVRQHRGIYQSRRLFRRCRSAAE